MGMIDLDKLDRKLDKILESETAESLKEFLQEEQREEMSEIEQDIGVVVGRFQVHELHPGHHELINYVCSKHKKVIIFLGVSPLPTTRNNPLDFESRRKMITQAVDVVVLPIVDMPSDADWSRTLDEKIHEVFQLGTVKLYGGRDSFISYYTGQHPTEEIGEEIYISGTGIRDQIRRTVGNNRDFRAGVIYAAYNQYHKTCATVDVAILRNQEVLLGRKPTEHKFRFIGGFSDPTQDRSYEDTAKREVAEETGVEIGDIEYISSQQMDDWRYKKEADKITSILFQAKYVFGKPVPGDDICELKWFHLDTIVENDIEEVHHCLLRSLKAKLYSKETEVE